MLIGWNDKLYFGKFKGQTVAEAAETDVSWLLWIREEKRKHGEPCFTVGANNRLDAILLSNKKLQARFKPFNAGKQYDDSDVEVQEDEPEGTLEDRRRLAYAGTWGSW